jgi:hypothetical protein
VHGLDIAMMGSPCIAVVLAAAGSIVSSPGVRAYCNAMGKDW